MLEVFIFTILSWFFLARLPFKRQHHPSGVTFWGLLRVKIIRTPKVRIILVIIQVHFIFEHGFLLPGVFHKEFLVISHNVNDQIYTIIIAQPNLDNQIGAKERVDINPQPLISICIEVFFFRAFDTDGDGKISKDEFRICMLNFGERFGEEEITDMVKQADSDMDGSINFIEFVQMLTQAEADVPLEHEVARKLSRKHLWSYWQAKIFIKHFSHELHTWRL